MDNQEVSTKGSLSVVRYDSLDRGSSRDFQKGYTNVNLIHGQSLVFGEYKYGQDGWRQ